MPSSNILSGELSPKIKQLVRKLFEISYRAYLTGDFDELSEYVNPKDFGILCEVLGYNPEPIKIKVREEFRCDRCGEIKTNDKSVHQSGICTSCQKKDEYNRDKLDAKRKIRKQNDQ